MKGKMLNSKFKMILICIIVTSTLATFFIPFMNVKADNNVDKYADLKVNWKDGDNTINVLSNKYVNINYGLTLSGGPVFRNLQIFAEDITENKTLPSAKIYFDELNDATVGNKNIKFNKPMNSGYVANGNIKVLFDRTDDLSEYDKTLQITLIGEYEDPNTKQIVNVNETKILTAHVTPSPIITSFSAGTEYKYQKYETSLKEYNNPINWSLNGVRLFYNVPIKTVNENFTDIELRVNRTSPTGISNTILNNEENLIISVTNKTEFENLGYTINTVRESDGTTYLKIQRGNSVEEYNNTELQNIDSKIEIVIYYKVVEDTEQLGTGSTLITTNFSANVEGFTTTVTKEGIEYKKEKYKYIMSDEQSINLWSKTSGTSIANDYDTWIKGINKNDTLLLDEIKNNKLTATYETQVKGLIGVAEEEAKNSLYVYNYNEGNKKATVKYRDGEDYKTVNLDNTEMTLNKIEINKFDKMVKRVDFYKKGDVVGVNSPFFTATAENNKYEANAEENITEYFAVVTGYNSTYVRDYKDLIIWETTWNIDIEKLKEKITQEQIENIRAIKRYQTASYKVSGTDNILSADCQNNATINVEFIKDNYMSYGYLKLGDQYNGNASEYGVWYRRNFTINFNSEHELDKKIKNVNPKIFIKLPNCYEYRNFKVQLSCGTNGKLYIKDWKQEKIENENFLIIDMEGTYDAEKMGDCILTITHNRKLIEEFPNEIQTVYAYMITDNENYIYNKKVNTYNFSKVVNDEELIPKYVLAISDDFEIIQSSIIETKTSIFTADGNEYLPGENMEGNAEISSEVNPVLCTSNSTIKYESSINVRGDKAKNTNLIVRLPIANNKKITNEGTINSTISLTNLNNIKVYIENIDTQTEVDPSNYTIGYGTTGNEDFSTTFDNNVTDMSTVKTLQVKFNDDYIINSGTTVSVQYEMTMPDQEGISGATTAVQYTSVANNEQKTLEGTPAYVKKGNPNGTIQLAKKFENYELGTAPNGISLKGIKFKFVNKSTQETLVLPGQTDTEGIIETDTEGKINLTNVPQGLYEVIEISEFDDYKGIEYTDVLIENGTATPEIIEAENKLKKVNLEIHKKWEDTNEQQGQVSFKLTNDKGFEATATTDAETGIATFYGIQYGTYTIEEKWGVYGWYIDSTPIEINNEKVVNGTMIYEVENKIAKGQIVIQKTVPEGDTVQGLEFEITGGNCIEYNNKQGEKTSLNSTTRVIIGSDYSNNEKIDVEIGSDNRTAKITLNNMPLGKYKIEEKNMPKIEETEIERYVAISVTRELTENNQVLNIPISNNWKAGSIRIKKTAATGVDLSKFKVRIKCDNTYYNTKYDEIFSFPANGELLITGLYLGEYTVEEVESDYFNAKYGLIKSDDPITVNVEFNKCYEANIHNENANGYVKILKTLEGKDSEKALGIKFKLYGKDTTGKAVEEIIEINSIEEINGVTYAVGKSGAIQAGGEYELVEVDETVPEYYIQADPIEVDIKKQNTENNPLLLEIENKRGLGKLEITTKTVPEGGELAPIRYGVTQIELNSDLTYTKIGQTTELTAVAGYSEIRNIFAGNYLVEQLEVPQGYIKDMPQLVEVPVSNTGYANFEIEKPEELQNTMVIVEKEILNKDGTKATSEDFQKAKLNEDESFEVKITNIETKEVYYTFFDSNNSGKIRGIVPGTYQIEELYKPKYINSGYLVKTNDVYTNIQPQEEKYLFTIEDAEESKVTIRIQNTINTEFGFGGQTRKDNYSKMESKQIESITKSIIYITGENGEVIPEAKFKIFDSNGNEVKLPFENNIYTTKNDTKVVINGLPVGTYTIKNISVPNGYLKPEDKVLTVYEGASRVVRIEILTNKPRGTLRLSTVYNSENGKEFVPRSKYKILDVNTNETLTFEKTSSGNYVRSNLSNATDTISLRAGYTDITGIETGNYLVGLTDVTEKYGVIKQVPENVNIVQNSSTNLEVEVKKRVGFKKSVNAGATIHAITEDGEVWTSKNCNERAYTMCKIEELYPELAGIKFIDLEGVYFGGYIILLDENHKVWSDNIGKPSSTSGIVCLSDIEGHPFNNLKINTVYVSDQGERAYFIDEYGKIWYCGNGIYKTWYAEDTTTPICISNGTILENLEITYLEDSNQTVHALDSNGNVYVWGYNDNKNSGIITDEDYTSEPICITTSEQSNLNGVKIKSVSNSYCVAYFIDYDDNLWVCGRNEFGLLGIGSTDEKKYIDNPICITKQQDNALYNVKIKFVQADYNITSIIDENGKVWSWGHNYCGQCGTLTNYGERINLPICISNLDGNELSTTKIKSISRSGLRITSAVDENGYLWCWGGYLEDLPFGCYTNNSGIEPKRLNLQQKSYFSLFDIEDIVVSQNNCVAIDKDGKLWYWGSNYGLSFRKTLAEPKNYNSSILGSYIENINIKDYDVGNDSAILLDTNNKVWIMSYYGNGYNEFGEKNSYRYHYSGRNLLPLCISDMEDSILYAKQIKFVTVSRNDYYTEFAVIDDKGKLYTAGSSTSTCLGYEPSTEGDYTKFDCVNDKYSELKDVKFEKVSVSGRTMTAIDSTGKVWTWGNVREKQTLGISTESTDFTVGSANCISPKQITAFGNTRIVDLDVTCTNSGGIALDEYGKVWTWGVNNGIKDNTDTITPICLSNEENILKGKIIVKVKIGNGFSVALDENGKVYAWSESGFQSISSITPIEIENITAKDIYAGGTTLIVKDTNNDLWAMGKNENGEVGVGHKESISELTKVTGVSENKIYDVHVKEIIDENNILCQDGENYKLISLLNGKFGSEMGAKQYEKVGKYEFVIGNDKYLYMKGEKTGYANYAKVCTRKVNKILCTTTNEVILLDETGNLLSIEPSRIGTGTYYGSNYVNYQYTLLATKGTDAISNAWAKRFDGGVILFIQRESGKLYFIAKKTTTNNVDLSQYSYLSGISNISDVTTEQEIVGYTGSEIKEMYITMQNVYCTDSNNKLYAWGKGNIGNGSSTGSTTPVIILENVNKFSNFSTTGNEINAVIDTQGNLWTWGPNTYGVLGNKKTSGTELTPVNISEYSGLGKINSVAIDGYMMAAVDESGKLFTWGYNSYYRLGQNNKTKNAEPQYIYEGLTNATLEVISIANNRTAIIAKTNDGKLVSWYKDKRNVYTNVKDFYITNMPETTITDGLILKTDGKLYMYKSGVETCINDEAILKNNLAKRFVLLEDAKFYE